jgi:type IV secretion system protein VirB5
MAKKQPEGQESPYLSARRTWNDQVGSLVTAKTTWQVIALLFALIAIAAIAQIAYVQAQSKFVPFVVKVDQLGQAVATQPLAPTTNLPPQVIQYQLAEFIANARMVTPDTELQKQAILRVYNDIRDNTPAAATMTAFYQDAPPFARAADVTVTTKITSILQQTPSSWEVDWQEITTPRAAQLPLPPVSWKAILTVEMIPPTNKTSEQDILKNPTGLYIKALSWTKVI